MSNLIEVNNDILKDWLDLRGDTLSSLTYKEDKNIGFILKKSLRRFSKMFPNRIKNMLSNNKNSLIIIF